MSSSAVFEMSSSSGMPRKRQRHKMSYITHLLRQRHQVVVDVYKPQRGGNVDEALKRFRDITYAYGKPKVPDIKQRHKVIRRESNAYKTRRKASSTNTIETVNNFTNQPDKVEDEILLVHEYTDDFVDDAVEVKPPAQENRESLPVVSSQEEVEEAQKADIVGNVSTVPSPVVMNTNVSPLPKTATPQVEELPSNEEPHTEEPHIEEPHTEEQPPIEEPPLISQPEPDTFSIDSELLREISIQDTIPEVNKKTYHVTVELKEENLFRSFIEAEWNELLNFEYDGKWN